MFEITKRDGLARIGKLETAHGVLETPALLPVINPRLITVSPRELYDVFGFQGVITNSYIIRNDPVLREKALQGKLHDLLDFPGTIMTDSGTFQSHMYGEVDLKNSDIVNFQKDIGSDIGTVLDIFTEPEWTKEQTGAAVDVTLERTREAAGLKGGMMLAGVVQGSVYPDLREHCAREMASIAVDVHPVGGVVPLMEQYRFADLVDVIVASKKGLNPSRPVHLFGAGHPMVFSLAVLLGCDMFDSASYAKFARDDRLMTVEGTMHLADMKVQRLRLPGVRRQDHRTDQGHEAGGEAADPGPAQSLHVAHRDREMQARHTGRGHMGTGGEALPLPPGLAGRAPPAARAHRIPGEVRAAFPGPGHVLHRTGIAEPPRHAAV